MADYTQVNDYSAKDALATGNPSKLIKGSDVDAEFSAISTAIASKFDSTDIASAGEAQAGTDNTKVITPARITSWAQNAAGAVEDIQALTDPGADRGLFWDDSAGAVTWLTFDTSSFTITGTTITANAGAGGSASADRTLTAGNGLSGGGDLTADRQFDLDFNELTAVAVASGDELAFGDISDTNTVKKITFANFEATLNHDSLAGFVANEHIDHTSVTITAGNGLQYTSGGTDISASATIAVDVTNMTALTTVATDDELMIYDTSAVTEKKVAVSDILGDALGDGKWYRSATQATSAATEATIVYNAAEYDSLQKGTFSTGTGQYTVGASAARIFINASTTIAAMDDDDSIEIEIQVNGTTKLRSYTWNDTDNNTPEQTYHCMGTLSLAASDVVRVRVTTSSAETIMAGTQYSNVSIVELA